MIGVSEISSGNLQKFNALDRVGSEFGNSEAFHGLDPTESPGAVPTQTIWMFRCFG